MGGRRTQGHSNPFMAWMQGLAGRPRTLVEIAFGISIFTLLFALSRYDYLIFHLIAEVFSSIIAVTIFILAWHTRRYLDNDFLLFLGIAFLFLGAVDLLHMLAYKGMEVFEGYGTDLPTQLWIAARYMQAFTFLLAPLFLTRRLWVKTAFAAYAAVTAFLLTSIFSLGIFPACFVEGAGLTPFKKISEYVISAIFLAAAVLLLRRRDDFDHRVFGLIMSSIALTIVSELSFTLYADPYSLFNLLGHFLKILAFYLIYAAIIETGLERPYEILFRNLKQREEMLEESEARYRELFENMRSGVTVYGAVDGGEDFVILDMNSAAEKIERLKREDVIGRRVTAVHPCITLCGLLEMLQEVWKHNESGYFPEVHCRYEGPERWKDFFIYKLPSGEVVAVYDDVSDRKLADNVLTRYREQLEEQVQERTLELVETNRRLNLEVSERRKKARELREAADRLRLLSDHLQTVREQERRRIALEVHDNLGQELTVLKMNLSLLGKRTRGDEEAEATVRELSEGIDRTISTVREIASELRPAVLDDLGLDAALEWHLKMFSEKSGIEASFSSRIDPELVDPDLGIALYRIAQEALTNVARHADATRVEVVLSSDGEALLLRIRDDGRGIAEHEITGSRSVGITSMNERAHAFGGDVEISSSAGGGTTVSVRIPHAATRESSIALERLDE